MEIHPSLLCALPLAESLGVWADPSAPVGAQAFVSAAHIREMLDSVLLLIKTLSRRFCGGVDTLKLINECIVSDESVPQVRRIF